MRNVGQRAMPWRKAVALGRQTLDWVEAAVAYRSVVQDDGNQPYTLKPRPREEGSNLVSPCQRGPGSK